jgi:hypothetical protein
MKKTLCIVTMLLAMASAAVAAPFIAPDSALPEPVGPRIVVPEPTIYFGSVESGRLLKHTFIFRNEGDADLVILKVSPP